MNTRFNWWLQVWRIRGGGADRARAASRCGRLRARRGGALHFIRAEPARYGAALFHLVCLLDLRRRLHFLIAHYAPFSQRIVCMTTGPIAIVFTSDEFRIVSVLKSWRFE